MKNTSKYEYLGMIGLCLFQILFTGYSLLKSPNSAYRLRNIRLFHLVSNEYQEYIVPVARTMIIHVLILMVCAALLFLLFKHLELPTVSVIVPLFILLTISVVLQDYMRLYSNSTRHFFFIFLGIFWMILGIFLSKYVTYTDTVRKCWIRILLCCLGLLSIGLFLWVLIGGYLFGFSVNGAYGIISIPGIGWNFTPCEWLKMGVLMFTGVAFVNLRLDRTLRYSFYTLTGIGLVAVLLSRDFGNFIILLALTGLVLYMLDDNKTLLIIVAILAVLVTAGFFLYSMNLFPLTIGYVVERFLSVMTATTRATADSTRQAVLSALNNGIFGSGTDLKMFTDNIYAVYTDYCFIAIQSIFGIGISNVVIASYIILFISCSVRYHDVEQEPMVYCYSNTLISVIGVQTIIHVAVNLNIFPYTGVVLPFISAGGTSIWMSFACIGMGLGIRMSDESYRKLAEIFHRKRIDKKVHARGNCWVLPVPIICVSVIVFLLCRGVLGTQAAERIGLFLCIINPAMLIFCIVPRRKLIKRFAIVIYVAMCIVLFVSVPALLLVKNVRSAYENKVVENDFHEESLSFNQGIKDMEDYVNIALFGLDTREDELEGASRSDTIMIVSICKSSGELRLVSVMRDTEMKIIKNDGDITYTKCNFAYANGGVEEAISMLNANLDLHITDYVTVNFAGLANIVDLIGGIDINIDDNELERTNKYVSDMLKSTSLSGEKLAASGDVHLSGIQTVAYCRNRYTTFTDKETGAKSYDDASRTARQRYVLKNIVAKVKKEYKNPLKLYNLGMDVLNLNTEGHTFIESSLDFEELLSLTLVLFKLNFGDTASFPFDYETPTINKVSMLVADDLTSNVSKLHDYLFGTNNYDPSEDVKEISNHIAKVTGMQ